MSQHGGFVRLLAPEIKKLGWKIEKVYHKHNGVLLLCEKVEE